MRVLALLSLSLLLASSVALAAELEIGQPAPPLPEGTWLLAPEVEGIDAYAGHLVLLAFWPDAEHAKASPWLDLWQETHWKKGMRVMVLARVDADALQIAIDQQAFAYPVASVDSLGDYEAAAQAGQAVLVDPAGRVAWRGAIETIDTALVTKLLRKVVRPKSPPTPEAIEALNGLAQRSIAVGAPTLAVDAYDHLQRACKRQPAAIAAAAAEKVLRRDAQSKTELAASKAFYNLVVNWMRVGDSTGKREALAKKLDRYIAKYGDTRSGAHARVLLETVRGDEAIAAIRKFIAAQNVNTGRSAWRTSLSKPPQLSFSATRTYVWVLDTSEGPLRIRFMPDVAPMHVSSTIYLTELGFYDGLTFHRVIPGFMAQGGDPLGNGRWGARLQVRGRVLPHGSAHEGRLAEHGQRGAGHRREPVLPDVQGHAASRRQAHDLRRGRRRVADTEEARGTGLFRRCDEEAPRHPQGHGRGRVGEAVWRPRAAIIDA